MYMNAFLVERDVKRVLFSRVGENSSSGSSRGPWPGPCRIRLRSTGAVRFFEPEAEGVTTRDLQIHFLALGRAGPVRTRTRWLAGSAHEGRLRVELVDTGHHDRLVAMVRVARPA